MIYFILFLLDVFWSSSYVTNFVIFLPSISSSIYFALFSFFFRNSKYAYVRLPDIDLQILDCSVNCCWFFCFHFFFLSYHFSLRNFYLPVLKLSDFFPNCSESTDILLEVFFTSFTILFLTFKFGSFFEHQSLYMLLYFVYFFHQGF